MFLSLAGVSDNAVAVTYLLQLVQRLQIWLQPKFVGKSLNVPRRQGAVEEALGWPRSTAGLWEVISIPPHLTQASA